AGIEVVDGHGVAQDVHVAVLLGQPVGKRLPLVTARPAPVDPQPGVRRVVLGVALDGDHVDGLRLVGVDVYDETEVGGQVATDLAPGVATVVAAHHVPVLLHEQDVGPRRVHGHVVDAVADLGVRVGDA